MVSANMLMVRAGCVDRRPGRHPPQLTMQLARITQGTVDTERTFGRARLVATTHAAGTRLEAHAHANPTFTFVSNGHLVEETCGTAFRCGPGSVFFKPAFVVHGNRYGAEGAQSVLIELQWDGVAGPQLPHAPRRISAADAVGIAATLARELAGDPSPKQTQISRDVENEVLELVALSFVEAEHAGDPGRPRWLLEAYERLADTPRVVPSVVDLAEEVGVHQDHLIRAFRAAYGETPGVFARRRRARMAAQLVCDRDRSLAAIAWTAGYADQSHMTREFGRFLGVTPGTLRNLGITLQ